MAIKIQMAIPACMANKRVPLMTSKMRYFVLIFTFFVIGGSMLKLKEVITRQTQPTLLKIGVPLSWGSLVPALQHTMYADAIMGNTFEPLVRNNLGVIEPVAALSWEVSADRTLYSFQIDTTRRFSNGETLTAQHFKSAWEHALKLPAKSANASLADVLYRTKGFAEFAKAGHLPGVRAPSVDKLEIEFSAPYRSALEDLAANRYAAAIYEKDKVLGTGPFVLVASAEEEAHFECNPFAKKNEDLFDKVLVRVVSSELVEKALETGELDAYFYFGSGAYSNCDKSAQLKCISGPETGHSVAHINGLKGRFFEQQNRRKALQSLVWKILRRDGQFLFPTGSTFRADPQFYLPFQAGRLAETEVEDFLKHDEMAIAQLVEDSQKNPLYVVTGRADTKLIDTLKKEGLALDPRSGQVPFKQVVQDYYKLYEADLIIAGASVWNGDPDGAYHVLGRSGAITSPMIHRLEVAKLLEEGREILDVEKLHEHYKKVSKAILTEVPFVHLGMVSSQIVYRTEVAEADDAMLARSGNGFHLFRKK